MHRKTAGNRPARNRPARKNQHETGETGWPPEGRGKGKHI